jgi:hypothetical protein
MPREKESIKNPADREHMWQRPKREDEHPKDDSPSGYRHQLPRILHHADGSTKRVDTIAECEAAFDDGWQLLPHPPRPAA